MAGDPDDIEEFFKAAMAEFDKRVFKAAFLCAQTAAVYIDISCRQNSKTSTGTLATSFEAVPAIKKGGTITAGAYSPLPYAAIRERGGRILPKKAKALSIPITANAKNSGSPLNWKGGLPLIYLPPKAGSRPGAAGVFATEIGKREKDTKQRFQVEYVLRYFVQQKGSGYISQAAKKAKPDFDKICADAGVKAITSVRVPKAR